MTQADDRVLETLSDSGLILSPRILSANTDYSRHYLSTRLGHLLDAGLVERVDEGLYKITDRGQAYLEGDLEAADLERDE
ncbi:MarR family transcriptional regulator [Natrarchaeobius halalkaliphilus]|uniref:MarR family transcriptional regulator n=1 Tax=Natrarchaeobius halalkaliphilus TaxID=1679091 RepID=A0A3N6MS46_9EURY|nr:MarR family transcriptional regulator [Natrarchaeobius halalkaliphilus]RQG87043.1 MarR family transcriptional regulator [Natrarchaeobius halalkaliphilus]